MLTTLACVGLVSLVGLVALGCAGRREVVHLGAERAERGGDRACGRNPGKLGHAASEDARRDDRATTLALECAAKAARDPEVIPIETSGDEGPRTCASAAQCYDGFFPHDDPAADAATLGDRCGRACGMSARSRVYQGRASEDDAPRVFAIELDAATCYRVVAVGGRGVRVLRAAIADASGRVAVIDNSRDRAPMLGPRDPFCPSAGGRFRLVVAVERGAGDYALRVWGRPRTVE